MENGYGPMRADARTADGGICAAVSEVLAEGDVSNPCGDAHEQRVRARAGVGLCASGGKWRVVRDDRGEGAEVVREG